MDWYPRAHRVNVSPMSYRDGGSMLDAPWRFVVHTTEGGTIAGAEQTFAVRRMWPHFCADPTTRTLRQYVPLSRAGRTLKNLAGGAETNRLACVQIELVGFADRIGELWTADACEWLGGEFADLFHELGIWPGSTPRAWVDATDGFVARSDAPQRMTAAEWSAFNGVCGHQHVPENDHYDPGRWNVAAFLAPIVPHLEEDMTPEQLEAVVRKVIREEVPKLVADEPAKEFTWTDPATGKPVVDGGRYQLAAASRKINASTKI